MKGDHIYLVVAYLIMWAVIFILPFYSSETYSIIKNTTSQLGAQKTPNSWIMNFTFIILGLASIVSGWNLLRNYWFHRIVLSLFGLSLIMTAFFQHAPIKSGLDYNLREDELHSLFAMITGFSFTLFAISVAFILKKNADKLSALIIGVLATVLSILMFYLSDFMGIWQRLIFISSFGWMIYIFRKKQKIKSAYNIE